MRQTWVVRGCKVTTAEKRKLYCGNKIFWESHVAFLQRPKSQLAFRLFLPSFERSNKTGISINHATVVNQKTNGFTKVIFKHAFILDFPFFLPLTSPLRGGRGTAEIERKMIKRFRVVCEIDSSSQRVNIRKIRTLSNYRYR